MTARVLPTSLVPAWQREHAALHGDILACFPERISETASWNIFLLANVKLREAELDKARQELEARRFGRDVDGEDCG